MLPFLIDQIDVELRRKMEDKPEAIEQDESRKSTLMHEMTECDKAIETIQAKIKANPSAAIVLIDTLTGLATKRSELAEAIANFKCDNVDAVRQAYERWGSVDSTELNQRED